jgi:hypothetical protein
LAVDNANLKALFIPATQVCISRPKKTNQSFEAMAQIILPCMRTAAGFEVRAFETYRATSTTDSSPSELFTTSTLEATASCRL